MPTRMNPGISQHQSAFGEPRLRELRVRELERMQIELRARLAALERIVFSPEREILELESAPDFQQRIRPRE
jgi:hypothetical protein